MEDQNDMTKVLVATGVVVGTALAYKALAPGKAKVLSMPPTAVEDQEEGYKSSYKDSGEFRGSTDRFTAAPIRYSERGIASEAESPAMTIIETLRMAVAKRGDKAMLRVERGLPAYKRGDKVPASKPLEEWTTWTYNDFANDSYKAAKAFITMGLEPKDAVAIFGFNSPEWFISEVGAIAAGGCAAGIYPTDTPAQVFYKAQHSGTVVACVETMAKARMFIDRAKELPKLKGVIVWDPDNKFATFEENNLNVVHWSNMEQFSSRTSDDVLEHRISNQQPGHACAYIYTSGTTGNPKAVMITHDNILFDARGVFQVAPHVGGDDEEERILSYLPLSHVAGMMVDVVCPITIAAHKKGWTCVCFARPYDLKSGTLGDRLRAVRPTMFLGVPRVWEKVAEKMKAMVAANPMTGLKLKIAKWAKAKGLEHQMNCQLGGSGAKGFGYGFAKKKVLDVVRVKLGLDCCKFAFTGAAPITKETLEYFGALGIQINEVYGMSECCGATTFSTDEAHVWGSCGWAHPGCEVKVLNEQGEECPRANSLTSPQEESQGEICFRGRHIMLGYMANPDLGDEHVKEIQGKLHGAIDDQGWLHSGDKGCIDQRGMLKITGRYKELIIGAGGENIAPVPIEDNVKKLHAGISNIMMVGDQRKFNVALVTLKAKGATGVTPGTDDLDGEALAIKDGVTTISGASQDDDYIKSIVDAIKATNSDGSVCISNASKIQKFTILPHDFSVDTEEFTPTYKLKRSVVHKKYVDVIDKMYASKDVYVPFN